MYKLTNNPLVIQCLDDGAFIPVDARVIRYQKYLDWLAAGNTPLPA